jgi:hypothetical protein
MAASKQLQSLKLWHYRLIDYMLANPTTPQHQIAAHFNISPVWMSIVANSAVFQAEYNRRSKLISEAVSTDVAAAAAELAHLSFAAAKEKLQREHDTMPTKEIFNCVMMAMHYLG